MSFVWGRAKAIAQKEVYHVIRDPFTLMLAFGLPIFLVIFFGFAIEFNVKNIHLAVNDDDKTQSSRVLLEIFTSSGYFIANPVNSIAKAQETLMSNKARAALIIPGGFEKDLFNGRVTKVQLLLDGSDNSTVAPILSYLNSIQDIANKRLADFQQPKYVNIKTRFLFNPELNSRWFVIPGLIVVIMSILSVLLTALTVAKEWENGSMELMLSTPAEPIEIIIGKLFPYAILVIFSVVLVYAISRLVFHVPFRGSLWVFCLGCILFLVTYLAQGMLISILTRSQTIASQIAVMTGLLPAQLLSGFIFPIESMPTFFEYFTMLLPARWFMVIARESYLKGSNFFDLIVPFCALLIFCLITITLAAKKFKRNLEV